MKILLLAITLLALALPAPAQDKNQVLARNQWTVVTKADFDAEMARIPTAQQFSFRNSAERVARLIDIILVNRTLAAQARAAKMEEDPAIKGEMLNQAERVLARHQQERLEAALKPPDLSRRAEELYKSNLKKYTEKALYHTAHVLVDTKCRTIEAATARASEARAEILAGTPFPDVVKKYSDDPSAGQTQGDLGPLFLDSLAHEYADAVGTMKKGEISQPVRSQYGVHVIRLIDYRPGRQLAYSDVRDAIIAELKEDWFKQERKLISERITGDPGLKLDLDAIQALKTNINAPAAPAAQIAPGAPVVPPAFGKPKG